MRIWSRITRFVRKFWHLALANPAIVLAATNVHPAVLAAATVAVRVAESMAAADSAAKREVAIRSITEQLRQRHLAVAPSQVNLALEVAVAAMKAGK